MKIDSRIQFPDDAQSSPVKGAGNGSSSRGASSAFGVSSSAGEDTVQLSGKHLEVRALAANLAQVPEIRAQRVQALHQRVHSGNFKPDSQEIADALIADHSKPARKA